MGSFRVHCTSLDEQSLGKLQNRQLLLLYIHTCPYLPASTPRETETKTERNTKTRRGREKEREIVKNRKRERDLGTLKVISVDFRVTTLG